MSSLTTALQVQSTNAVRATYTGLTSWTPPSAHALPLVVDAEDDQALACSHLTTACTHTALAYRHSGLLLLCQASHMSPDALEAQEHLTLAIMHCEATIASGGPVTGLLWPLFTAARYTTNQRDKARVRRIFAELQNRQGMVNIERAWATIIHLWSAPNSNILKHIDSKQGGHGSQLELMNTTGMSTILV